MIIPLYAINTVTSQFIEDEIFIIVLGLLICGLIILVLSKYSGKRRYKAAIKIATKQVDNEWNERAEKAHKQSGILLQRDYNYRNKLISELAESLYKDKTFKC